MKGEKGNMTTFLIGIVALMFLGVFAEIIDELKGIRKALETIVRSVSIYEIKDNS